MLQGRQPTRQSGHVVLNLDGIRFPLVLHGPIGELVGSDFFTRGAIVFAAKFRGAAPRRAAPRSMRGDARRADHAY
eukprot:SAG31_NODE_31390_length_368_cov_4.059480_1_plen_75_part_10